MNYEMELLKVNETNYANDILNAIKNDVYEFFKQINTNRISLIYVFRSYNKNISMNLSFLDDRKIYESIFFDRYKFVKWFRISINIHDLKISGRYYLINDEYRFNTTYKLLSWSDEYEAYVTKPYLFNGNLKGILDNFLETRSPFIEYIPIMAKDVIRILKGTVYSKGLIIPKKLKDKKIEFIFNIIELSVMLITTEKLRNKRCNALLYLEFLRLKHFNNIDMARDFLKVLFTQILLFTKKGGVNIIRSEDSGYFLQCFLDIVDESLDLPTKNYIYYKKFEKMKALVKNEKTPHFNKNKEIPLFNVYEESNEYFTIKDVDIIVEPLEYLKVEKIKISQNMEIYKVVDK